MKPVCMKLKGHKPRYFDNFAAAIDYMNRSMAKDRQSERVTISLPVWLKEELKDCKRRTGCPMSAQGKAWILKGLRVR